MEWEDALRARLIAVPAINAIVGNRVSWFERPRRGGLPAIELTNVAPGEEWTHEGPNGLLNPRVQFDVWAEDVAQARDAANALKEEMQRLDAVTVDGWTFLPPAELNMRARSAEDLDGGKPIYRIMFDFSFNAQPEDEG